MWCDSLATQPELLASEELTRLCQRFVRLDEETRVMPDPQRQRQYADLYAGYLNLLQKEYPEVKL
ncbi:hypothetical protein D3C76_1808200 [compost metagenome]|jgi:xylulokinase